jgi:hypothetical protein
MYFKPTSIICEGLTHGRMEGTLVNDKGEVICFDPCVYEPGPSSLLIRKDYLIELLQKNGLCIAWVLYGEKQIIGGRHGDAPPIDHRFHGLYYLDDNGKIVEKTKNNIKNYEK